MRLFGLVLAGGRSRRFGREKAASLLRGEPLIHWATAALARDCERVAVNAPDDTFAAHWAKARGLPVLPDPTGWPDGPLSGVAAGLAWIDVQGGEVLVTVPCDMPDLPADLPARLTTALGEGDAAFVVSPGGPHPLCAVWRTRVAQRLADSLRATHPPVRRFLDQLDARMLEVEDEPSLRNVNRPEDLA